MAAGLRAGYLGPAGTNTEVATLKGCPGAELVPYTSILDIARAVAAGELDRGVVPIENSLQGTITDTLDALLADERIAISGEVVLAIEHCLMAAPGVARTDVQVIYSHPQSLGQCRKYLEAQFPKVRTEAALSNAEAVAIAMKTPASAAIGPARAAEIYGADILERGIEDSRVNKTRFVVLSREGGEPTGRDKTSIAFAVAHDRPGTLVSVLHEFSDRAINMTKIESRPSGEQLGVYVFLVDVDGHRDDAMLAQALAAVREQAAFFRIFGSYPAWQD